MEELLLRYLVACLRYPAMSARRFIRAGLGLETRSQYLAAFWMDHFSRSRAAQTRWARNAHGNVLLVLGAGPLSDFNSHALAPRFKQFRLVDGNPLLVDKWTTLNQPFEPVVTDITNCVARWAENVRSFPGSWQETLQVIKDLALNPVPAYSSPASAVLSLNIASQLEVGWQEVLEPILRQRFGRRFVKQREDDWLTAIRPSSQVLVEQHLSALEFAQAHYVLLISDIEYVEYTGRRYRQRHREDPPVRWTEAGWCADEGISFEVTPALEGVDLNHATFKIWMPSYQLEWHESWLWHIAPNGTETTNFGRLHRVGAFALRHCDAPCE